MQQHKVQLLHRMKSECTVGLLQFILTIVADKSMFRRTRDIDPVFRWSPHHHTVFMSDIIWFSTKPVCCIFSVLHPCLRPAPIPFSFVWFWLFDVQSSPGVSVMILCRLTESVDVCLFVHCDQVCVLLSTVLLGFTPSHVLVNEVVFKELTCEEGTPT